MTQELAEVICKALLDCTGKLDRSVSILEGVSSQEFLKRYRRLVGQILGLFYIEILRDLFHEHPGLEPESMRSDRSDASS